MKKIEYVRKRDGRLVPFDKQKIADAIFKAAQSVGGHDRYLAEDLAEVVKIYLEKEYTGDIPSVEEIQDIVERILIKTGHAKTAKAYILYRQKRARARQIRQGRRPEDLSERELQKGTLKREVPLSVRRSDERIDIWDTNVIVDALVRETGLSRNIAELIVAEVEEDVIVSKVQNLTSSMIRELVNAKLVQYGFEAERLKHSRIGLPFYDITAIFNTFGGSPDELSVYLGRRMKREFAFNSIIPQSLVKRHIEGEITIQNIEGIDKFLTAYIPVEEQDIPSLCGKVAPFVEADTIFCLSGKSSYYGNGFFMEFPFHIIKGSDIKVPHFIRIERKKDMEEFFTTSGIKGYLFLHKKTESALFVLNRITLNIPLIHNSVEDEGVSLQDRIKDIIKEAKDMAIAQEQLVKTLSSTEELLSQFNGYITTMEIELEYENETEGHLVEEIIDELFSLSLSLFIRTPDISLLNIVSRYIENRDILLRIYNG